MNSRCFIACWFGGQKICATRYCWIMSMCSAFSMQSHKGVIVEMWMPLVDT
uniref:Uncharacterized protein n=1 Tax=Manihot esculenta TaxID=3983 RepID=A0A2C9UZH5_MANES